MNEDMDKGVVSAQARWREAEAAWKAKVDIRKGTLANKKNAIHADAKARAEENAATRDMMHAKAVLDIRQLMASMADLTEYISDLAPDNFHYVTTMKRHGALAEDLANLAKETRSTAEQSAKGERNGAESGDTTDWPQPDFAAFLLARR